MKITVRKFNVPPRITFYCGGPRSMSYSGVYGGYSDIATGFPPSSPTFVFLWAGMHSRYSDSLRVRQSEVRSPVDIRGFLHALPGRPKHPPVQRLQGLCPRDQAAGTCWPITPSSAEIINNWSSTAASLLCLHGMWRGDLCLYFGISPFCIITPMLHAHSVISQQLMTSLNNTLKTSTQAHPLTFWI